MKIMMYEVREDERAELTRQAKKLGISLETSSEVPVVENAALAAGCEGVSILAREKLTGRCWTPGMAWGYAISPPGQ